MSRTLSWRKVSSRRRGTLPIPSTIQVCIPLLWTTSSNVKVNWDYYQCYLLNVGAGQATYEEGQSVKTSNRLLCEGGDGFPALAQILTRIGV
jgi:hypothetical protein